MDLSQEMNQVLIIYPPYPNIPKIDYYNSYFYHSTPLATNLLGGIDIRLAQNLSLNIAAGYTFRIMKVKYATWEENEDVHKTGNKTSNSEVIPSTL